MRSDLVLLGGVVTHPVAQWRRWRELAIVLFRDGGATINTPPAEPDEPILACTVIQADGDVLLFLDDAALDPEVLDAHHRRVGDWYDRSRATVRQAYLAVRAAGLTLGAILAATCGVVTDRYASWVVASLVSAVAFPLGGWALGLVGGVVFRRRIDAVLRQLGVAG